MFKILSAMVIIFGVFCTPVISEARAMAVALPQKPIDIKDVSSVTALMCRWDEAGAVEKAESLLKAGGDINAISKDYSGNSCGYGETPLTQAILSVAPNQQFAADVRPNRYDAVMFLLEHGANINIRNERSETPLHVASAKGDVGVLMELIKRGADINAVYSQGDYTRTVLEASVPFGINAFRILMDKGAKVNVERTLNDALYFTSKEFLETFLSYPIEIPESYADRLEQEEKRDTGRRPLVNIIRQHMALMKEAKASGKAPVLLFKRLPIVTSQIIPPKEDSALVLAVRKNDLAGVKAEIEKGASANEVSRVGRQGDDYKEFMTYSTPVLHLALSKQLNEVADYLMERGAHVNMTNAVGDTPLIIAARTDNAPMVEKLLAKGADVNAVDLNYINSPLELARSVAVAKLLLAKGADVNHVSKYGSVMHTHVQNRDHDILRLLSEHHADINVLNYESATPLHYFIRNLPENKLTLKSVLSSLKGDGASADLEYVRFLVSLGADVKIKNGEGYTAYDLAVQRGRSDIADYLENTGSESGDPEKVMWDALYRNDVATVKKVLEKGYDAKDSKYAFAAINEWHRQQGQPWSSLEMLKLLAEHGTDLLGTDKGRQEQTLLHQVEEPAVIDFLVQKGADVNAVFGNNRETPLHLMARDGKAVAVESLLKNKAFPNAVNSSGASPLCEALKGPTDKRPADGPAINWATDAPAYYQIIKLLMQAGADAGLKDKDGCKPYFSDEGYAEFRKKAEEIISDNAAPIAKDSAPVVLKKNYSYIPEQDVQALFKLVSVRYLNRDDALKYDTGKNMAEVCAVPVLEAAKKLYEANKDTAPNFKTFLDNLTLKSLPNNVNYNGVDIFPSWQHRGYNLLHMAAHYGDVVLVKELLNEGMDVKKRDANGNTVLHYATSGRSLKIEDTLEVIREALQQGVDINALNKDAETALFINNFMTFKQGEPTPHYILFQFMVDQGSDVTIQGTNRNIADAVWWALKSAQQYGKTLHQEQYAALLAKLEKQGVTPHVLNMGSNKRREEMFKDPLMSAVIENNLEKATQALANGAVVSRRFGGTSPLFQAVDRGDDGLAMAKLLIEHGARIDEPAGYESLAARATLQDAHGQMVKYLLEKGLKVHSEDLLGMRSISGKNFMNKSAQESLQLLLDQGIDPNVCDTQGESPLAKAVAAGNLEAAEILVKNGARADFCGKSVTLQAVKGLNPRMVAIVQGASSETRPSILADLRGYLDATPNCRLKPE